MNKKPPLPSYKEYRSNLLKGKVKWPLEKVIYTKSGLLETLPSSKKNG